MNETRFPPAPFGAGPGEPAAVPLHCLTPGTNGCFHRFFDTSPVSPSGRYVALTRLLDETRPPAPGDRAEVIVVDLEGGETAVVAETRGFATQLGAQAQWGRDDRELYFNDLDLRDWRPYAVRLDPLGGHRARLEGSVYMVSPDGARLASPCLRRAEISQGGYGVTVPPTCLPFNVGASDTDGLWVTDTATGVQRLLISFRGIVDGIGGPLLEPPYRDGAFYGFHVKWNPQGTRLMFVVRYVPHDADARAEIPCDVITLDADGGTPRLALPWAARRFGGHHPNWTPDGEWITQNLVLEEGGAMRFVRFRADGTGLETLGGRTGSGHPTMHPDGRHLLTDAYPHEPVSFPDGTGPLRWIDLRADTERTLARIPIRPDIEGPLRVLRVDPHPAWDRTHTRFVFNAFEGRTRRVYLADAKRLLSETPLKESPHAV